MFLFVFYIKRASSQHSPSKLGSAFGLHLFSLFFFLMPQSGKSYQVIFLRLLICQIVLAEILAAEGQLVVLQMGQDLLELEEKSFAWLVAVGVHVELG